MFGVEFTAEFITALSVFIATMTTAIVTLRQAFTKQVNEVKDKMDVHNAEMQTAVGDVATKVDDVKRTVNGGISG